MGELGKKKDRTGFVLQHWMNHLSFHKSLETVF